MSKPITRVIHDASKTPIPDDRWVLGWDLTYHEWRLVRSKEGKVMRWTLSFLPDGVISNWMESTAPVSPPAKPETYRVFACQGACAELWDESELGRLKTCPNCCGNCVFQEVREIEPEDSHSHES